MLVCTFLAFNTNLEDDATIFMFVMIIGFTLQRLKIICQLRTTNSSPYLSRAEVRIEWFMRKNCFHLVCEDNPDYADGCPGFAATSDYCKDQEDFMRKNCPKSCGFCSEGQL